MSWLTDFVRPRLARLIQKHDVPENLWQPCTSCDQVIFHRELKEALFVCPHCDYHMRLGAKERFESLFDKGYTVVPSLKMSLDPLKFQDTKRYTDRLRDARQKTKNDEAVVIAKGMIRGRQAVVAAFDFSFIGGSMSQGVGELLLRASHLAVEERLPLIIIPSSGGARMQEGLLSLIQMPRSILGKNMMTEAGLPYLIVMADPTTGGVAASFASLGDVILAEPGALIGFTGRRVIQETTKEPIPDDFQTAEFQYKHGFVDKIVHRRDLPDKLSLLIDYLTFSKRKASVMQVPH